MAKNIAMIYIWPSFVYPKMPTDIYTMGHKMGYLFQKRFSIFFDVLFGGRVNEIQIHHENLSDYSHYVWTCHIIHSSKCWFYANFKMIFNFVEFIYGCKWLCFWFIHQLDIKAYENIRSSTMEKRERWLFFFQKFISWLRFFRRFNITRIKLNIFSLWVSLHRFNGVGLSMKCW